MKFGNPEFFLLLLMLPLFLGLFLWGRGKTKKALARFATPQLAIKLAPETPLYRKVIRGTLLVLFFIFLVIALTRPRFGNKLESFDRKGIDVMVALDISESMLAEDVTPSRLERAKFEISKLFDMLKGDRVGLIIFAGESFVQCPMTLDYGAAKMFLESVKTDWIQTPGTALGDAIKQASEALGAQSHKYKVLVLISDGEDHEGATLDAARKAADDGVIVYTVGVGSETGAPIPTNKGEGTVRYKQDASGAPVMTRLDPLTLQQIATAGKGKFFQAGTNLDLSVIMDEIDRMEKKDLGLSRLNIYEERYQIFLGLALLMFIIEFLLPSAPKRKKVWKGRFE